MESNSVNAAVSVLMPVTASDVRFPRRRGATARRAATRAAGPGHRAVLPFPSNIAAELRKANDALVRARHLRQYVERLMSEQNRMHG